MEYLQFGFAGAFCILMYIDQRTTIRALVKSVDRATLSLAEIIKYIRENKADS